LEFSQTAYRAKLLEASGDGASQAPGSRADERGGSTVTAKTKRWWVVGALIGLGAVLAASGILLRSSGAPPLDRSVNVTSFSIIGEGEVPSGYEVALTARPLSRVEDRGDGSHVER